MVVIRLAKYGTKHKAKYRVMVADSRRWAKGKYIEILGSYNPDASGKEEKMKLDMDKINAWIKKGAQPSDRIRYLMRQLGQKI